MGKIEMTRISTGLSILASLVSLSMPFPASALVITEAGHYVVDTRVDGILIEGVNSRDVSIEVVSGGVVEGDILCGSFANTCNYDATVSGTGMVLGHMQSQSGTIVLNDNAWVGVAGGGPDRGGRLIINDNAYVGQLSSGRLGDLRVEMNGGYTPSFPDPDNFILSMSDGIIDNRVFVVDYLQLEMSGGAILGDVIGVGNSGIGIDMRAGRISGTLWAAGNGVNGAIYGGAIDGDLLLFNDEVSSRRGSLEIWGGRFGLGSSDPFWRLSGDQDLDVYGLDLMFEDGFLSGYLRDSSYLNVRMEFGPSWSGEFNYHNVPEPGALALMGIGLAGIGLAHRRRAAERR